jgi:DNA polymerase I-like protein with 3'-5' exonuclease and polymerase domains
MSVGSRETFRRKAAEAGQDPLFAPTIDWTAPQELPQLKGRGIKRLAIDFETKDPELRSRGIGIRRGSKAIGLAVGTDDGRRWYFPTGHAGGGNLDEGLVKRWAKSELDGYDGEVCGANLSYDLDYAAEWGVDFPSVKAFHDVQIAEPLLDENRLQFSLDALSKDYLGEGKDEKALMEVASAYGFSTPESAKSNLWRLPAYAVGGYAEGDVDRPLRILEKQLPRIEEEELSRIYEIERKLIPILVKMRRRGVPIDVKAAELLRVKFVKGRDLWLKELKRIAGPKAELMEPLSFYQALEARGIPVPRTEKTGQPSVTAPMLGRYASDDLVKAILNGRKLNTLVNTFLDGQILGQLVGGRVYPTWNQLKDDDKGTIARLSGSFPNLQFIPSRDQEWQEEELAHFVRDLFLPEDGEETQRADYSQIEYRFLVNFAVGKGAEDARELYKKDPKTDFHLMTMKMLGIPASERKLAKGKKTKITNFAKVYGAQVPQLASQMGCSNEEAEEFVKQYNKELPFVEETMNKAQWWAQKRGFVTTILGRRRRYPFWGPKRYKKESGQPVFRDQAEAAKHYGGAWRIERVGCFTALNGKMQGSSADLIKTAMVQIEEAGLTSPSVLGPTQMTVHDELVNSIPKTKAGDEAGKELVRIMERAITMIVPIVVEADRGKSWGACK